MLRRTENGDFSAQDKQRLAANSFRELLRTAINFKSLEQQDFYNQIINGYRAKLKSDTAEDLKIYMNNMAILMSDAQITTEYPQIGKAAESLVTEIHERISQTIVNLDSCDLDYSTTAVDNNIEIISQSKNSTQTSSGSRLFPWNQFGLFKNNTGTNHQQHKSNKGFDK